MQNFVQKSAHIAEISRKVAEAYFLLDHCVHKV